VDTQTLSKKLAKDMRDQSLVALKEATIILFVIDGREGCTPYDQELADLLRRQKKPVFVIVNKCEGKGGYQGLSDAASLGLGEPVAISAEHNLGMGDLQDILLPYVQKTAPKKWTEEKPTHPLKLAIIGRPNVGKSTLANSLLGEERQLTADFPGVTRDSISLAWTYQGQAIELIDTAGIRRKSRIDQDVEKLAVMDTERTLRFAEVVILVIDGSIPFEKLIQKQDLTLASLIVEEGRCVIFAINKWDQVKSPKKVLKHLQHQLDQQFSQARGITCVPISALNHKNLETLMDEVFKLKDLWNKRLTTGELNRWLQLTAETHPPPAVSGRRIRFKYMTQIKTRPPTFVAFCTKANVLPDSYKRYLVNTLRQDFDMPGVPIRLSFRSSKNPYAS
jgi:GTP-binding protein